MTPSARLAAAIEILDELPASRAPADGALKAWGRNHRFAGSKDRRAIAEHVYVALRHRVRSQWRMNADDGRAMILGVLAGSLLEEVERLFSGEGHAPAPLSQEERDLLTRPEASRPGWVQAGVSQWLEPYLRSKFGLDWLDEARAAVLDRAPVDLRVNALRGPMDKALNLLSFEKVEPNRTAFSTWGLRLPAGFATDVHGLKAFTTGWIEIQDEASQIAAALAGVKPGALVVDYCAGGGGKTLALAAHMGGRGRLVASDVDQRRLEAIKERLARAGARAEIRSLDAAGRGLEDLVGAADVVFVDAPCSGSGTWRRHPEAAWRLTPETLTRLSQLQRTILDRAAALVKKGGRLVYATCSMLAEENDRVAADFFFGHPDFAPTAISKAAATPNLTDGARERLVELSGGGHTLQLTPRRTGTDGFFAALFERIS